MEISKKFKENYYKQMEQLQKEFGGLGNENFWVSIGIPRSQLGGHFTIDNLQAVIASMRELGETFEKKKGIPVIHLILLKKLDDLVNKLISNCDDIKIPQEKYEQIREELFRHLQSY